METGLTKYNNMKMAYRGMVLFTLFYSIITTIITACKTEVLVTDFFSFITVIKNGIIVMGGWISSIATLFGRLGYMIPHEELALIIHWVLVAVVYTTVIGGTGWLIFILGRTYIKFFKDKQADEIYGFVGGKILAIMIFMADIIKSIQSILLV